MPQKFVEVHRVRDIHLRQEHEVIVPLLDGKNRLGEAKAKDVPNIVRPQVESWGAGQPAQCLGRCQVKVVAAMPFG